MIIIKLSQYQKAAATHYQGPALVLAGPGSGKTTVLTERVRYLIEEKSVSPEKILVVTFARFAAAQMKERFLKLTSGKYNSVTFSTIHSVCYSILNSRETFENYRLLSETKKSEFLSETIKKFFIENPDKLQAPGLLKDVVKFLSQKNNDKNIQITQAGSFAALIDYCRRHFESFKERNRLFDFDDMAQMTEKLLSSNACDKESLNRFEYVLVDEFQDTAPDQFSLLKLLCKKNNFYGVGDEDQSIYGFRGACPEIMLKFEEYFGDCSIYRLPENFRSHAEIVNIANKLIANNKKRYNKSNISAVKENLKGGVRILTGYNENEEMELLISEIRRSLKIGDTLAVLVRTRGVLEVVAGKLIQGEIEFNLKDKINNIFEVPVVQTVMSFYRVASGVCGNEDFIRIFRTTDIRGFECLLGGEDMSIEKVLAYYEGDLKAQDFLYNVLNLKGFSPLVGLEFIRNALGLERRISTFDKAKLSELGVLVNGIVNVEGVFELERNYKEVISKESEDKNLTLATIHSSKGLEFDRVFVPCVNEGNIPSLKAVSDGELEEERRIFYVALTRARKEVVLSFHESAWGKKAVRSRFMGEIFKKS